MEYILTDKLLVTEDFITDLIEKSWQEIEHMQAQIANIEQTEASVEVIQLLKKLLTSYYVFVGGLESIKDKDTLSTEVSVNNQATEVIKAPKVLEPKIEFSFEDTPAAQQELSQIETEPFEYFVYFDEPTGEPLTDDDLYN
jgi:hypothetical protein